MRVLTVGMQNHLAETVTTLATVWRLYRRDGVVLYITSHDTDIVYPNGDVYKAILGVNRSSIESNDRFAVDETEIRGFIDLDDFTEADIRAKLWDNAEVEIAFVNWADPAQGEIALPYGNIGEITIQSETEYNAELAGPVRQLQQNLLRLYALDCPLDLGDERCKVPIYPDVLTRRQTVSTGEFYRVSTLLYGAYWENAITNASFEIDSGNGLAALTGWDVVDGLWDIMTGPIQPVNGTKYLGGSSSATSEARQDIDLAALSVNTTNIDNGDVQIQFSGWRSNDFAVDRGQIIIEFLDAGMSVLTTALDTGLEEITPTGVWEERTLAPTVLTSGTRHIRVRVLCTLDDGSQSNANFDHFVLSITDNVNIQPFHVSHASVVVNGSFEFDGLVGNAAAITGWQIVSGLWDLHDVSNGGLAAQLGSIYLEGGASASGEVRQDILLLHQGILGASVDAGLLEYTFSIWRANSFPSDLGRVVIEALDDNGALVSILFDTGPEEITPEDTWVERTAAGVIPADTRTLRIRLSYILIAGLQGNASFDNAVLSLTDRSTVTTGQDLYENRVYEVLTAGLTNTRTVPYNTAVDAETTDGSATLKTLDSFMRHGQITDVIDRTHVILSVDEPRAVDNWFSFGGMVFETGRNRGRLVEIRLWTASTQQIEFYLPPSFIALPGDRVRLYAGCDKRLDTCLNKFDNVLNYGGYPFIPGADIMGEYPIQR